MTANPRQRPPLRLAPPASALPDDRAAVARALLTRYVPVQPGLSAEMLAFLGLDVPKLTEIERDPRYLIGRLTQALAALLARDVPPPNATSRLLTEAIRDAVRYRPAHLRRVRARGRLLKVRAGLAARRALLRVVRPARPDRGTLAAPTGLTVVSR